MMVLFDLSNKDEAILDDIEIKRIDGDVIKVYWPGDGGKYAAYLHLHKAKSHTFISGHCINTVELIDKNQVVMKKERYVKI